MNISLEKMVDSIASRVEINDEIKRAFLNTPRSMFVPQGMLHIAYQLDALPLSSRQFISSPLTVAKMTKYLEIDKNCDSVLEVGLGSGYQAVILSKLVRRVFSIERIEKLHSEAVAAIKQLGIMNIHTRLADGQNGWDKYAPYDRILFSASATKIPESIISQLANGGILVAPIVQNGDTQVITRFIKRNSRLEILDTKDSCSFVPILDGIEQP